MVVISCNHHLTIKWNIDGYGYSKDMYTHFIYIETIKIEPGRSVNLLSSYTLQECIVELS